MPLYGSLRQSLHQPKFDNDHDPMPGHQLNILLQDAVSDLYIFDHQRVNITLGSILESFIPQSKVDNAL